MKKLTYLLTTGALLAACSSNPGYTVKGTIAGTQDGDTIYLQKQVGRQLVNLDSTTVQNGTFTFEGRQDTTMMYYLTYKEANGNEQNYPFFLENGNIQVNLTGDNKSTVTGTPCNDTIQLMSTQVTTITDQMKPIFSALNDTTLSFEERQAKAKEMEDQIDAYYQQIMQINQQHLKQNITNAVGAYILKNTYTSLEANLLDSLLAQVPAMYEDDAIRQIKERAAKMKATAEGKKFTDFEMQTPDGKPVKLSDYAGKNKLVLVDFWASWCGPCRREMPEVVELYKKYKGKGLEIVGVSLDRDAEAWKKGIKDLNITWPQMSDLKYWNCEGAQIYAVNSIPHTMLIDGEGTIVARGLRGEELQNKIAEILK